MAARAAAAALAAALALATAGCGPSTDGGAGKALDQTADSLGHVHSGNLAMSFTMSPAASPKAGRLGVTLKGPFSLRGPGPLPKLDITYSRIAGATSSSARLVSTGQRAFVLSGGQVLPLSPAQAAPLRLRNGAKSLDQMGLDPTRWVKDPRLQPGPKVDGKPTDLVTGRLDAPAAAADFARLSRRSGAGISARDRERIEQAVGSSAVRVLTGHEDRLLRAMSVRVKLDLPPGLRAGAGGSRAVRVEFQMAIGHPNARVAVSVPPGLGRGGD